MSAFSQLYQKKLVYSKKKRDASTLWLGLQLFPREVLLLLSLLLTARRLCFFTFVHFRFLPIVTLRNFCWDLVLMNPKGSK